MTTSNSMVSASLYVGDLHPDVRETVLYDVFNAVGPVASIRVCRDSTTKRSLCYAYVNYHSVTDAERALDGLNYSTILGVPCRIMWSHRDPQLRKSGNGNIFVKNLDRTIDNKALYDTFSLFGNILSCKVAIDSIGKSLGYGFVHYETPDSAATAVERVNNMLIGTKNVYVGPFMRREDRHTDPKSAHFTNVYVKNIPESWTVDTLKTVFEEYGEVNSHVLQADAKGKFAFVNFVEVEAASEAVAGLNRRRTTSNGVAVDGKEDDDSPCTELTKRSAGLGEECDSTDKPSEASEVSKSAEVSKTAEVSETADAGKTAKASKSAEVSKTADAKEAPDASEAVEPKSDESKADEAGKAAEEGEGEESEKKPDAVNYLYVSRAQTKAERAAFLKAKFDQGELSHRGMGDGMLGRDGPHAHDAHHMMGLSDHGEEIGAQMRGGGTPFRGDNLYIKNLDDTIDDVKLREIFEPFGTITSAKVMIDDKGKSRGFGFVSFLSTEEATKAVTELHFQIVNGKPLYVGLAERRDERTARLQKRSSAGPRQISGLQGIGAVPPQLPYHSQPMFSYGSGANATRPTVMYSVAQHHPAHPGQLSSAQGWRGAAQGAAPQQQQRIFPHSHLSQQITPMYPMGAPMFMGLAPPTQPGLLAQQTPVGAAPVLQAVNNPQASATQQSGNGQRTAGGQRGTQGSASRPTFKYTNNVRNREQHNQGSPNQPHAPQGSAQATHANQPHPNATASPYITPTMQYQPNAIVGLSQSVVGAGRVAQGVNHQIPVQYEQSAQLMGAQRGVQGAQHSALGPLYPKGVDATGGESEPKLNDKRAIGERMFPLVQKIENDLAGKITGMMLEMDNAELVMLLSNHNKLRSKVIEAKKVLENHNPSLTSATDSTASPHSSHQLRNSGIATPAGSTNTSPSPTQHEAPMPEAIEATP